MTMVSAPDSLYCADLDCSTPNDPQRSTCIQCGLPLLRRYLWLASSPRSQELPQTPIGQVLENRYRVIRDRVLLDSQPASSPTFPPDIPERWLPYFRLFGSFGIPRIYGVLSPQYNSVLLLESSAVYTLPLPDPTAGVEPGQLMPRLIDAWPQAGPHRQLSWLWQLMRFWQQLSPHQIAHTLLDPELVRVNGSNVHLLELNLNRTTSVLVDLAANWQQLLPLANASVLPFLQRLITLMQTDPDRPPAAFEDWLERALIVSGQQQVGTLTIVTQTDIGKTRKHNEDARYPLTTTTTSIQAKQAEYDASAFAMVCDGLGGHERGEVASQLAVDVIVPFLNEHLNTQRHLKTPNQEWLRRAIVEAHQAITNENQQIAEERQRMGTTLVAATILNHCLHIANVGDSRAYLITPRHCTQITADDNLATRYVMSGIGCYRQLLATPSAAALVQALGISPINELAPTLQRFYLDDEVIILLCSDGLSDRDRVEEIWSSELVPVFKQQQGLEEAARRLTSFASRYNGHDNITLALLHYQVSRQSTPNAEQLEQLFADAHSQPDQQQSSMQTRATNRRPLGKPSSSNHPATAWALLIFAAIALGVGIGLFVWPSVEPSIEQSDLP